MRCARVFIWIGKIIESFKLRSKGASRKDYEPPSVFGVHTNSIRYPSQTGRIYRKVQIFLQGRTAYNQAGQKKKISPGYKRDRFAFKRFRQGSEAYQRSYQIGWVRGGSESMNNIQMAINDLANAERLYNEADPNFEEVAWYRLQEARARLSALIREAKKEMLHNAG